MNVTRESLNQFLETTLGPHEWQDYGPNGLQIEGQTQIKRLAFAVSATKESIQRAIQYKAQGLIVHHGLFWKFHGTRTITGSFYQRVAPLIKNDINLWGFHLPLDAHIPHGNAASLAHLLDMKQLLPFGDHKGMPTGVKGVFEPPIGPDHLLKRMEVVLGRKVLHASPNSRPIKSMGIITGGANNEWVYALKENLDAYCTGEMSEHNWHESQESGIHMFAGGHHATEKWGILSLMKLIGDHFGVETQFFDSENPA